MKFEYTPKGVCSSRFIFDINGDTIEKLTVIGGCAGNTKGISNLVVGMKVDDVISRLEGIPCRPTGTSCPDQISRALKQYKAINA